MVDEIGLMFTAGFGGLAGSVLTFVVSHFRANREQKESTKRLKAIVKFELTEARNHIATVLMLKGSTEGDGEQVGFRVDNDLVLAGERLFATLLYPNLPSDIKIKSFDSTTLTLVQEAYVMLGGVKIARIRINDSLFRYNKTDLTGWRDKLDSVIKTLG
jgi:hypothetical protein